MEQSKQSKLAHYESCKMQSFLQVDGFCRTGGDSVTGSDENGDSIMLGITQELMRCPGPDLPVRLLIHEEASLEDVRRLLTKVLDDVLDRGFEFLREELARELFARGGVPSEPPF